MNKSEEINPKNSKTVKIITDSGAKKYGYYDAGDWLVYDCKEVRKILKDTKHELPIYIAEDGEVLLWEEIDRKKK